MKSPDVVERVQEIFSRRQRPAHFTNYWHCDECEEHDETLSANTPETISLRELGNPSWDPMCFASDDAYLYYFPALARLAFGRGEQYYLDQFVFHFSNYKLGLFSRAELEVVHQLLTELVEFAVHEPASIDWDLRDLREYRANAAKLLSRSLLVEGS